MSPIKVKAPLKYMKMSPVSKKAQAPKSPPLRKSRRKFDFPLPVLVAFSIYRQDEAAERLGVSSITLKRICSRRKYKWPYRTIKAQRRREDLVAQKLKTAKVSRNTATKRFCRVPSSPVASTSEILLQLHQGRKEFVSSSPTSVSGISPISSPISSPKAQFPLTNAPFKLPPLTLALQWHKKPLHHQPMHRQPFDYKSSAFAASFDISAPKFPTNRLASLVNTCEAERRLLPSTEFLLSRYQNYHS